MSSAVDVADYIMHRYEEISHEKLDEMKLHKLLYFTQRESFAVMGKPAFEGDLEGWKYGPVCKDVRTWLRSEEPTATVHELPDDIKYVVNNVILEYGALASWKLSELSHKEISWKNARKGLGREENGSNVIALTDIEEDAKKVRPYDHLWDMYYDEFEDVDMRVVANDRYDWRFGCGV